MSGQPSLHNRGSPPSKTTIAAAGATQRIEGRRGSLPADMRLVGIFSTMVGARGASQVAAVGELEACQQGRSLRRILLLEEIAGETPESFQGCAGLLDAAGVHETSFLRRRARQRPRATIQEPAGRIKPFSGVFRCRRHGDSSDRELFFSGCFCYHERCEPLNRLGLSAPFQRTEGGPSWKNGSTQMDSHDVNS